MRCEKPVAVDSSDHQAIRALSAAASTRIIANHQLRYHPTIKRLLADVQQGRIGVVQHIDASARLSLSEQGSHLIDLAVAFNNDVPMTTVFGSVTAPGGSSEPGASLSQLVFLNGIRATLACGDNARRTTADRREYRHKRIAVYGTRGFVHWQMHRWESFSESAGYAAGQVDYGSDDVRAQAALIEAALDTCEDDQSMHPGRLDVALAVNDAILGCYASTVTGKATALPFNGREDLLPKIAGSALLGSLFA